MDWIHSVLEMVYDTLFGCGHDRLTRPFTLKKQTYMVCLDCGRHVYYSAERMEPLSSGEIRRMRKIRVSENKVLPATVRGPQLVPSADTESSATA